MPFGKLRENRKDRWAEAEKENERREEVLDIMRLSRADHIVCASKYTTAQRDVRDIKREIA